MAPPTKRSKKYNVDLVDLIRKNHERRRELELYDLGNGSDTDSFCSTEAADALFQDHDSIISNLARQNGPVVDLEAVVSQEQLTEPENDTSVSTLVSINPSNASQVTEIGNEDNEEDQEFQEDDDVFADGKGNQNGKDISTTREYDE